MSDDFPRNSFDPMMMSPGGPIPGIPSLYDIKLNSFSVSPAAIKAGEAVEVRWSATVPRLLAAAGLTFELNGSTVGASGTRAFRPVFDTAYSLVAKLHGRGRTLASVVVDVDVTGCTLSGKPIPVGDIGETIKIGVADLFFREEKHRVEVSPGIALLLWIERLDDMTFTFDSSQGALRFYLPLKAVVEGTSAEGELTTQVWFALATQYGRVVALNAKTETDLKFPWQIWLVAIGSPYHFSAVINFLYAIGPDLASGKIKSALGSVAALIGASFGDRVSGVRIDYGRRSPEDELEPFIFTTVCP